MNSLFSTQTLSSALEKLEHEKNILCSNKNCVLLAHDLRSFQVFKLKSGIFDQFVEIFEIIS